VLGFKCVSQVHFGDKSLFDSLDSVFRDSKIKHQSSFPLLTLLHVKPNRFDKSVHCFEYFKVPY